MPAEADDFRDESAALYDLLAPLSDRDFDCPTAFKSWTLNDILAHLHFFNVLADESLIDERRFEASLATLLALRAVPGATMVSATAQMLDGLAGRALLERWRSQYTDMAPRWLAADAKQRLKWVGPSMSVRSSITARLMETWSHAQAVYDLMAVERQEHDRIRSVAVLGVNTFGWTFSNRHLPVPPDPPCLRLRAPSGQLWEWHEASDTNRIEGLAVDFCRVVTQVRHVADTGLQLHGDTAARWMSLAQCFAGPPNDPPTPGSRRRADHPPAFRR